MNTYQMSGVPSVSRRRTKFLDPWNVTTSMNVGNLYPIQWQEVLPGDDFDENISFVVRQTSPYVRTPMEQIFLDVYAFFVPGRILQSGYESIFGNPNPSQYVTPAFGKTPCFNGSISISPKSVGDYLGLPIGTISNLDPTNAAMPMHINVLPFRAFAKIYNEWFRDENNVSETYVSMSDNVISTEYPNANAWSANNYVGLLPKVKKIPDYFTTCVSSPQKGNSVVVPISGSFVPIVANGTNMSSLGGNFLLDFGTTSAASHDLTLDGFAIAADKGTPSSTTGLVKASSTNVGVNLTNQQVGVDVDALRLSMQKQLMLYTDTIYGSRYREYILGHYGVSMKDERAQVPEFLCGRRIPLGQQDVAQTSASTSSNPLGFLASYSYTAGSRDCRYWKGFSEHGYVFWVGCLRYKHSYQQGVARKWMRQVRDDFYDPLYSHIGYQPVYKRELYTVTGTAVPEVFGYGEAWREYVHTPRLITGQARSKTADHPSGYNSLDVYHFGDLYSSAPVIGQTFVEENNGFIDHAISVAPSSQDQFVIDFYCDSKKTRVRPMYCQPGLADHFL